MRALFVFMAAGCCFAASTLSSEQRRLNVDSFEYVWKTVLDKHWDPKLGGVNWQAAHDELLPRVESAQTMEDARQIISALLARLHQTHFAIFPMEASENSDDKSEDGQTGIDMRILDGHVIVSSVDAGSSAAEAGVKTGWEVARIGKTDTAPSIAKLGDMLAVRRLRRQLDGEVNSDVEVQFSDVDGKVFRKRLTRRVESGEVTRLGFLPPMPVRFSSKKLADGVEFTRFNLFLKPDLVITKFGEAVGECGHCPGIVIDLRGNPGGLGAMAMGIAGFLISKQDQKLGTMYLRTMPLNFVIFPRAEVYPGRVAILVDEFTASTSEIFAEGLQDLKRARVFGQKTAGAALPSHIERLPNGDGFQFAVANYISESGRQLEGNGVVPDVEVRLNRKALSEGRDAVLEAALKWLEGGKTP